MRERALLLLTTGLAALAISISWPPSLAIARIDETRFPHARHAGLFPSCNGCHGGVLADDSVSRPPLTGPSGAALYPEPTQCAGCHDGQRESRVTWNGPRREPSNLAFSHAVHNREADLGDPALNCRSCHATAGSTQFMAVTRAQPQPCVACHGHRAPAHLGDESPCRTCHVPVTRATLLSAERVARFPRPPSHERPEFLRTHGLATVAQVEARCGVCHARESCERCHADAATVPQIALLGRDSRVRQAVVTLAAEYPIPESHRRPDWPYAHGSDARANVARCGSCHTQPSCRSCHTGRLASDVIGRLPSADSTRGVRLRGHDPSWKPLSPQGEDGQSTIGLTALPQGAPQAPSVTAHAADTGRRVRVHPPGFDKRHGAAAASSRTSCEGCHTRSYCSDCHDGEAKRRFHPANFSVRHPTDAYARQRECSACHNREAFCGACHQRLGLRSQDRRDVAYHTAQPLWLLQHARAARQGLESCTTCHVQRDCMRCHSQSGWGVNPHGKGFDPRRLAARNAQTCRYCHLGDPLR